MLTKPDKLKLFTLMGNYPNAMALKEGKLASDQLISDRHRSENQTQAASKRRQGFRAPTHRREPWRRGNPDSNDGRKQKRVLARQHEAPQDQSGGEQSARADGRFLRRQDPEKQAHEEAVEDTLLQQAVKENRRRTKSHDQSCDDARATRHEVSPGKKEKPTRDRADQNLRQSDQE